MTLAMRANTAVIYRRALVCYSMNILSKPEAGNAPPAPFVRRPPTPAALYQRAHEGKLMIMEPKAAREPVTADFFHIESVGTHPTGLVVTGRFASGLSSMMASSVREANAAEIASHDAGAYASKV